MASLVGSDTVASTQHLEWVTETESSHTVDAHAE